MTSCPYVSSRSAALLIRMAPGGRRYFWNHVLRIPLDPCAYCFGALAVPELRALVPEWSPYCACRFGLHPSDASHPMDTLRRGKTFFTFHTMCVIQTLHLMDTLRCGKSSLMCVIPKKKDTIGYNQWRIPFQQCFPQHTGRLCIAQRRALQLVTILCL